MLWRRHVSFELGDEVEKLAALPDSAPRLLVEWLEDARAFKLAEGVATATWDLPMSCWPDATSSTG